MVFRARNNSISNNNNGGSNCRRSSGNRRKQQNNSKTTYLSINNTSWGGESTLTTATSSSSSASQSQYNHSSIVKLSPSSSGGQILWSCVARHSTVLCEAADPNLDPAESLMVAQTARELLGRSNTPGYEFHTANSGFAGAAKAFFTNHSCHHNTAACVVAGNNHTQQFKSCTAAAAAATSNPSVRLKGIRFHVYEQISSNDDDRNPDDINGLRVWIFAAVYHPKRMRAVDVKVFLQQLITTTEHYRAYDYQWRHNHGTLACQQSFAPILLQRMQDVAYFGPQKTDKNQSIEPTTRARIQQNIELILDNEGTLQKLNEESSRLQEMSIVFRKNAKKVKRMKLMQDAKHGLILGACITAGVAIAVVPPLVVLL